MINPGSTIGILGGGQLGRMLAIAAAEMGYHTHIYCPEKDAPASEVAKFTTTAAYEDVASLKHFAKSVDVITYEFENIPAQPLEFITGKIRPSVKVLKTCQHRVLEKQALNKLDIATARFVPVKIQNGNEYLAAAKKLGTLCVLKTATMGYDGKGQWKIKGDTKHNVPPGEYIVEEFVTFRMEISVIVARGADGSIACFPPVQNIHKDHILSQTIAPAPITPALAKKAEKMARTIAEGLGLVGLMAVEMFVTKDNKLLVNELAPRPHNSGHWTIDACPVSQFEQTIRAICGMPLGSAKPLCSAKMLNLIGDEVKQWEKYLQKPDARVHLYGKKETRPGRKMGHVTLLNCEDK